MLQVLAVAQHDLTGAGETENALGVKLQPVVAAIDASRKTLHLMRQNLWLAIGYNALAVPVAISGVVTPLIAAAAMSGSSILVMLNSLRARSTSREIA